MIKLKNGHKVVRADVWDDGEGEGGQGTVIAEVPGNDKFVTWTVAEDHDGTYLAFNGHYFPERLWDAAVADYNGRRGVREVN